MKRLLRLASSLYRCTLYLYPATFRAEFGGEMCAVFNRLATDAAHQSGAAGVCTFSFRMLIDTLRSGIRERCSALSQRLNWRSALIASLVIGMLTTPADPVSMVLVAAPLYSLYFLFNRRRPQTDQCTSTVDA